jgi:chromosome segregation ATPase
VLNHQGSPELRYINIVAMEHSALRILQLTTQLKVLKDRVVVLESQLKVSKDNTAEAMRFGTDVETAFNELVVRLDNAEEDADRLEEEARTTNRELRRLKKEPKENASHLANLTRVWLDTKHPSTDGYPEGEVMDKFVVLKLIKDILRNHSLIE